MMVAMDHERGWEPDWAIHPGALLEEHLEVRDWSQAEFARRSGLTRKLVSTIISGKNPVSPETAIALERVLGVRAYIWTAIQSRWDIKAALEHEHDDETTWKERLAEFPVADLKKRGILPQTKDVFALGDALLRLSEVGSWAAYDTRLANFSVQYRHSGTLESSKDCLFIWLQIGLWRANRLDLPPYDADRFGAAMKEIRTLTREPVSVFWRRIQQLCAEAGVACILEKPLPKTRLSGAAFWTPTDTPVIQLSLRHKSNDHFWFSLFHEAAHILLHPKGESYVDETSSDGDDREREADAWAEDQLIGRKALSSFIATAPRSAQEVCDFADQNGLHPGIVVGALQHKGVIPWSNLNKLKDRFEWSDQSA